jgi:hypothetical protein
LEEFMAVKKPAPLSVVADEPDEIVLPQSVALVVEAVIKDALRNSDVVRAVLMAYLDGRQLTGTYDLRTSEFQVRLVKLPTLNGLPIHELNTTGE